MVDHRGTSPEYQHETIWNTVRHPKMMVASDGIGVSVIGLVTGATTSIVGAAFLQRYRYATFVHTANCPSSPPTKRSVTRPELVSSS